jgi:hypothetical protein
MSLPTDEFYEISNPPPYAFAVVNDMKAEDLLVCCPFVLGATGKQAGQLPIEAACFAGGTGVYYLLCR